MREPHEGASLGLPLTVRALQRGPPPTKQDRYKHHMQHTIHISEQYPGNPSSVGLQSLYYFAILNRFRNSTHR